MGEIADEHRARLFWSEGTGIGGDCGEAPPCDHPAYGGMDAWISRRVMVPENVYRCKFCNGDIGFIDRQPYNRSDGALHRCLAEARRNGATAQSEESKNV